MKFAMLSQHFYTSSVRRKPSGESKPNGTYSSIFLYFFSSLFRGRGASVETKHPLPIIASLGPPDDRLVTDALFSFRVKFVTGGIKISKNQSIKILNYFDIFFACLPSK